MALSADTIACRCIKNSRLKIGILMLLFVSCTNTMKQERESLPFYNTADFDAEWIGNTDAAYAKIHTIDTFSLTSQLGHTITNDSLKGFIYVANFFFTTCQGICPKMVNNLTILQDSFAANKQIKLVSFSVMPWIDSVGRLQQYATANHVDSLKWFLLTGSMERIYALGRKSYFAEKGLGLQKDNTEFLHTESMLLIDKHARIRGIYNATQKADIERVTDDIKVLLKE